jgi:hypothetical protein
LRKAGNSSADVAGVPQRNIPITGIAGCCARAASGHAAAAPPASASRPSGQWRDDDYDVLEKGVVVGRIFKAQVAPQDRPWMWASGHAAGTVARARHGYEATREAAMMMFREELARGG